MSGLLSELPALGAVGIALLLMAFLLSLARRRLQPPSRRRRRDVEVIGLTPQHRLHVVSVAGQRLVVGTGPDGPPRLITTLHAPQAAVYGASSSVHGSDRGGSISHLGAS